MKAFFSFVAPCVYPWLRHYSSVCDLGYPYLMSWSPTLIGTIKICVPPSVFSLLKEELYSPASVPARKQFFPNKEILHTPYVA